VSTNKQRREASRRHLERQLEQRQEREAARRRFTFVASVVGSVLVVAAVVAVIVIVGNSGGKKKAPAAAAGTSSSAAAASSPSATPSSSYPAATGKTVTFDGVTVTGATDLTGIPGVTSTSSTTPTKLEYKDLVVGTGTAAAPSSTVTVQYVGVLYKDGTEFDASWTRGMPAQFSLAEVVKGFTYGIGGTTGVPAMKVGGRRIVIIPSALGYGATAQSSIPANSPLVFVIDLKSVDG
jgi:hypothetical protein